MPKTTYVWDELSDNVIEEYEDGVLSVSYTHEPGLYGNLLSQNRNGVTSYYHYDGRGDTVALTDDSGNVTDTKEYDAWGNVIASTGTTVTPYQFGGRIGYRFDGATPGCSGRARQYVPFLGRWLSPDPVWPFDHINAFVYCRLNPVNLMDPSGELCGACCCCPDSLTFISSSLTIKHPLLEPGKLFGHYFEIDARVSLLASDQTEASPCSVQWWENTSHSPANTRNRARSNCPDGVWCEKTERPKRYPSGLLECGSGTLSNWCQFEEDFRNGKVPCPPTSIRKVKLFDAPSLLTDKNAWSMRILYFHVTLKGSCGSCSSSELAWEGCQILGIDEKNRVTTQQFLGREACPHFPDFTTSPHEIVEV